MRNVFVVLVYFVSDKNWGGVGFGGWLGFICVVGDIYKGFGVYLIYAVDDIYLF